jgi:molybdopterin synthase catalytic subunit
MRVTVRYWAVIREHVGKDHEELELSPSTTAMDLYNLLAARYGFGFSHSRLRVAVGEEFVDWSCVLVANDEVSLIPPVAGG